MSITVGQLTQTANALSAIDWSQLSGLNLDDFGDDTILAEDVLSVAAVFWPPAALLGEALAIAVVLAPLLAAAGLKVTPDQDPEVDAQTTQSRGGRNP